MLRFQVRPLWQVCLPRLVPRLEPQLEPRLEQQLGPRLEPQLEPQLEMLLEPLLGAQAQRLERWGMGLSAALAVLQMLLLIPPLPRLASH
jgi:hypothetical protein